MNAKRGGTCLEVSAAQVRRLDAKDKANGIHEVGLAWKINGN